MLAIALDLKVASLVLQESSCDKEEKEKEKVVAQMFGKNTLPKESIKTQKVTNAPNLISQSKPLTPKEIMVNTKMQTYINILSTLITGASVTPEECIPINKRNIKSFAILPLRKDAISN